jgi:hypothetical protein
MSDKFSGGIVVSLVSFDCLYFSNKKNKNVWSSYKKIFTKLKKTHHTYHTHNILLLL